METQSVSNEFVKDSVLMKLQQDSAETKEKLATVMEMVQSLTSSMATTSLSPKRKLARVAWQDDNDEHPVYTFRTAAAANDGVCSNISKESLAQPKLHNGKVKVNLKKKNDCNDDVNILKCIHEKKGCVPEFSGKKKHDGSVDILFDDFQKAMEAKDYFDKNVEKLTVGNPSPSKFEKINVVGIGFEMSVPEVADAIIHENKHWLDLVKLSDNTVQLKSDPFSVMHLHNVSKCKSGIYKVTTSVSSNMLATLGQRKLSIGYVLCKTYKWLNHGRCYNCQQYGHFAGNCKNKVACSKCGLDHLYVKCNSNFEKCVNCMLAGKSETDHPSYSLTCPCKST